MVVTVQTRMHIAAPAEKVWEVLTAFDEYEKWNPFIISAQGHATEGQRLRLTMNFDGSKMKFRPRVRIANGSTLEWLGRVAIPGLFDGLHRFELEQIGQETLVTQSERFTGLGVRFVRDLQAKTTQSFELSDQALRNRVLAKTARKPIQ